MAKKSKAQRARASARRQGKKERARIAADEELNREPEPEVEKGKVTKFLESTPLKKTDEEKAAAAERKREERELEEKERAERKKNKKPMFQGLRNVRAEMRRVTWPTRQDVARWSLVVIVALIFFTFFVIVLDNFVVTPLLYFISGFAPTA
jgi:preprotein translocase subunit SecE